jgi:hypothetical protein
MNRAYNVATLHHSYSERTLLLQLVTGNEKIAAQKTRVMRDIERTARWALPIDELVSRLGSTCLMAFAH